MDTLNNLTVPGPTITPVTKQFWDAAARGEFILQHCSQCGKWVFYPRTHCPHCWSDQLEWKSASGEARLKTWSVVHRPGHPAWQDAAPYVVGIVELAEGPSMMTHLLTDSPDELRMGIPLHVRFIQVNGVSLPFFE